MDAPYSRRPGTFSPSTSGPSGPGRIPTFSTFDLTLGYALPTLNSRINLSVQNLFSCTGGTTAPNIYIGSGRKSIYTKNQKCGFGHKHAEMLNSPELGTMFFLGVRYQR